MLFLTNKLDHDDDNDNNDDDASGHNPSSVQDESCEGRF